MNGIRQWWQNRKRRLAERKVQKTVAMLKKGFADIEAVMTTAGFNRQEKKQVRRDIVKGHYTIFEEKD